MPPTHEAAWDVSALQVEVLALMPTQANARSLLNHDALTATKSGDDVSPMPMHDASLVQANPSDWFTSRQPELTWQDTLAIWPPMTMGVGFGVGEGVGVVWMRVES